MFECCEVFVLLIRAMYAPTMVLTCANNGCGNMSSNESGIHLMGVCLGPYTFARLQVWRIGRVGGREVWRIGRVAGREVEVKQLNSNTPEPVE